MIIPVVFGAILLGRSFDMNEVTPRDTVIFDEAEIEKTKEVIQRSFTKSQYRIIENFSDVNDFLNVNGNMGIKAMKGDIQLVGQGDYFSDTVNRENTVEVLFSVYHEDETHTFPSYTKMRTDWEDESAEDIGTHYMRSITYGGLLVITYRLTATSSKYMEDIKAAVSGHLSLSGNVNFNASGNFEKLNSEIGNKTDVEIKAWATTGKPVIPQSITDIFNLVDEYPKQIQKGIPVKVEVVPLATLTTKQPEYVKNPSLDTISREASNKFDDIKNALSEFKKWDKKTHHWNPEQDALIKKFNTNLNKAHRAFKDAISNLDPTGGIHQFDKAFKLYGLNEMNLPRRFTRELLELKHKIDDMPLYWFPYTKSITHYVHWGSLSCTLPSSEPVFLGFAGTAPKGPEGHVSFGSGGSIECLPADNPGLEKKELSQGTVVSYLNGLNYVLPDKSKGPVLCAFCRLENATSVITIPGLSECPGEMKLEYSGYLMTSKNSGTASSFICLDKSPETNIPNHVVGKDETAAILTPVWMICPDCFEDDNKRYIGCVVCSR